MNHAVFGETPRSRLSFTEATPLKFMIIKQIAIIHLRNPMLPATSSVLVRAEERLTAPAATAAVPLGLVLRPVEHIGATTVRATHCVRPAPLNEPHLTPQRHQGNISNS